jgi:hypothetical protein
VNDGVTEARSRAKSIERAHSDRVEQLSGSWNAPRDRGATIALDAFVLVAAKLALGAYALRSGFTHLSDDDYARTVIAEQFAHAPKLDPSGTSWLPFPFWICGFTMMVAGRSLDVARAVALGLGAAAVVAPYLALRAVGTERMVAIATCAIAMALPYSVWLGVATVPEGWVGPVTAAALIVGACDRTSSRERAGAAMSLLAASLSRYEAWPACVAFVVFSLRRLRRGPRAHGTIAWALLATAGPLAWMAWNAHAHGDALSFLARVTTFRRAVGVANMPMYTKLLGYPRALVLQTPDVALLGVAGTAGVIANQTLRARWGAPLLAAGAIVSFLVAGEIGDGAPTHHPARALVAVWWILVAVGVDSVSWTAANARRRGTSLATIAVSTILGVGWALSLPARIRAAPGGSEEERRDAQIARGLDMRARAVRNAEITPCAFEHFALLAAWGEPEKATVNPPAKGPPATPCPVVRE